MIIVHVENESFDELEPEISWIKGVSGVQTGGPPLEPIWRPLRTWRRVLRTISQRISRLSADLLSVCLNLSLPEGFTLLKWFH